MEHLPYYFRRHDSCVNDIPSSKQIAQETLLKQPAHMVKIDFVVGKFLHEDVIHTVVFEDNKHGSPIGCTPKEESHKKNFKHINRRHAEDNKQDK